MTEVDRYLEAATRQNTQRSYASALRHFEIEWGGHLPATPDSVARYLAEQAPRAAIPLHTAGLGELGPAEAAILVGIEHRKMGGLGIFGHLTL